MKDDRVAYLEATDREYDAHRLAGALRQHRTWGGEAEPQAVALSLFGSVYYETVFGQAECFTPTIDPNSTGGGDIREGHCGDCLGCRVREGLWG